VCVCVVQLSIVSIAVTAVCKYKSSVVTRVKASDCSKAIAIIRTLLLYESYKAVQLRVL
jgi:hypothetical protein